MVKNKRPTLQDIADRVGATKMTVSRCLRGADNVSKPMRERIFAEAEALGYIPNRAPDLLSKSTSHAIGVLLPSLTNQVFADVIKGVESVTEPAGYHLMLSHYGYSPEIEERSSVVAAVLQRGWCNSLREPAHGPHAENASDGGCAHGGNYGHTLGPLRAGRSVSTTSALPGTWCGK